jgi:hypothetical protein
MINDDRQDCCRAIISNIESCLRTLEIQRQPSRPTSRPTSRSASPSSQSGNPNCDDVINEMKAFVNEGDIDANMMNDIKEEYGKTTTMNFELIEANYYFSCIGRFAYDYFNMNGTMEDSKAKAKSHKPSITVVRNKKGHFLEMNNEFIILVENFKKLRDSYIPQPESGVILINRPQILTDYILQAMANRVIKALICNVFNIDKGKTKLKTALIIKELSIQFQGPRLSNSRTKPPSKDDISKLFVRLALIYDSFFNLGFTNDVPIMQAVTFFTHFIQAGLVSFEHCVKPEIWNFEKSELYKLYIERSLATQFNSNHKLYPVKESFIQELQSGDFSTKLIENFTQKMYD